MARDRSAAYNRVVDFGGAGLVVCGRPTKNGAEAVSEERRLLNAFRDQHKRLPFANAI